MKRLSCILLALLFFGGCSTYTVKNDLDETSLIKGAAKAGVLLRVPEKSRIIRTDMMQSIGNSLNGYQHITQVNMLPDLAPELISLNDNEDRFYQQASDEYLRYKSIGIIQVYLRKNADTIKSIMERESLDCLVIYEVYSVVSVEMQMIRFDSVVAVVDKNLKIAYLDHQDDTSNSTESDFSAMRTETLNYISSRFIEVLMDLGFLKNL